MATTAALAIATALTLTTLTPVTAAAAAPTEAPPIVLNERCITGFNGTYPVESGFELAADAQSVYVGLPRAISDNVYTLARSMTQVSFTVGDQTIPAELVNVDAVSVLTGVPEEVASLSSGTVVTLNIYTWMDSHPCSNTSDTSFIYEMSVSVDLTLASSEFAPTDYVMLEGAKSAQVGYGFLDWTTPAPVVHWGDRIRIVANPGYFPAGARLDAVAWLHPHYFDTQLPLVAVASPDGSSVVIDLPAVAPVTIIDTNDWTQAGLAIYGLTPSEGSITPALDLSITEVLRVTGTAPTMKATPRAFKTVGVNVGQWGPAPVKLAYQWLLDGKPIAGATKPTYTVKLKDVNRLLSVRVTGTRTGYETTTLTSKAQRVKLF